MHRSPEVIIASRLAPKPEAHEIGIAWILANHFTCTIEFLQPSAGYKMKTPDIVMGGILWEIKSPTGRSQQSTIQAQFKGLKQSRNLIIDGRRTKLDDALIEKQIALEMSKHTRVGKVLFITKLLEIIEL
jgi:hypothetical protein